MDSLENGVYICTLYMILYVVYYSNPPKIDHHFSLFSGTKDTDVHISRGEQPQSGEGSGGTGQPAVLMLGSPKNTPTCQIGGLQN